MNPLELAAANSRWARVNVGEKALLILGLLVLAISLPPWPALLIIGVSIVILAIMAQVPARLYITLVAAPASFVAVGLGPLIFAITPHGLVFVDGGINDALVVLGRCIVGMSATMLFALTTPMSEQLMWFRTCGMPESLVHVVMLTYRMTSTLIETARTMWDAQSQRLGHSKMRNWIRSVADQSANLFVISFARARKLQEGLELRAPLGATATWNPVRPARLPYLLGAAAYLLAVIAVSLVVHFGWN